jgi:hypothetical protein
MSDHAAAPPAVPFDLPKAEWGDGPWQTEPDRVDFTHAGLPCLLLRNHHGAWCGYAAVPPGHPWHGKDWTEDDAVSKVEVHWGINYTSLCDGFICHVPAAGEPADVWWFGFSCDHAWDVAPTIEARLRSLGHRPFAETHPEYARVLPPEVYRDLAHVRAHVERLAEQLAAAGQKERTT